MGRDESHTEVFVCVWRHPTTQRAKNALEFAFRKSIVVAVRLLSEQVGGGHEIVTSLSPKEGPRGG